VPLGNFLVFSVGGINRVLTITLDLETAISLAEYSVGARGGLPVSNEQLKLSFLAFVGLQLRLTHATLQFGVVALLSGFLLLFTLAVRFLLLPLLEVALALIFLLFCFLVQQGLSHVLSETNSELNIQFLIIRARHLQVLIPLVVSRVGLQSAE
jgi:hypothetical protein